MFRLDGNVAIVTGASRGLGAHIATGLAAAGADVALVARTVPPMEQVAGDIRQMGRKAECFAADLTQGGSIQEMVAAVHNRFDAIDLLVNNAGINIPNPALEVTEADWDRVLDLNLKSASFTAQAVGRVMVSPKRGRVINISSQMEKVGFFDRAAYCASKPGLGGLTKVLAVEWAPEGVTVNAVAPTFIETPMTRPMFERPAFREEVLRRIPMGRLGQPEDVTAAVIYLGSDQAGMVTGHTLSVDGGWVAW